MKAKKRTERDLAAVNQLQYQFLRGVAGNIFAENDIFPETEIWIYPDYPDGWHAVCGANENRVYVLWMDSNSGDMLKIENFPVKGFRPNGSLIY